MRRSPSKKFPACISHDISRQPREENRGNMEQNRDMEQKEAASWTLGKRN